MMTERFEIAESAALRLTLEERAELIERLIDTVVPPPQLDPSWSAEIDRRLDELEAGRMETVPAEQVFGEMRPAIAAHEPEA